MDTVFMLNHLQIVVYSTQELRSKKLRNSTTQIQNQGRCNTSYIHRNYEIQFLMALVKEKAFTVISTKFLAFIERNRRKKNPHLQGGAIH